MWCRATDTFISRRPEPPRCRKRKPNESTTPLHAYLTSRTEGNKCRFQYGDNFFSDVFTFTQTKPPTFYQLGMPNGREAWKLGQSLGAAEFTERKALKSWLPSNCISAILEIWVTRRENTCPTHNNFNSICLPPLQKARMLFFLSKMPQIHASQSVWEPTNLMASTECTAK